MNLDSIIREAFTLLQNVCNVSESELIAASDNTNNRQEFFLPKRSGGRRLIVSPHATEKFIQTRLLHRFFTRLLKRHNYYWCPGDTKLGPTRVRDERQSVCHQQSVRPLFSHYLHGGRLRRNVKTALLPHTHFETPYVMRFDLADAFGSVRTEHVKGILHRILLDEVEAAYVAYQERLKLVSVLRDNGESAREAWKKIKAMVPEQPPYEIGHGFDFEKFDEWCRSVEIAIMELGVSAAFENYPWFDIATNAPRLSRRLWKKPILGYPKHPLFPANQCLEFRKLIRQAATSGILVPETEIPQILNVFLEHVLEFVTHQGVLPQGFPTSGILLNLVISDCRLMETLRRCDPAIRDVSIYVDDIVVTYNRRPDEFAKRNIQDTIARSGIFSPNTSKTAWYDLRSGRAAMLGLALNRRIARAGEPGLLKQLYGDFSVTRGLERAERQGRNWKQTFLTLPKATQKRYRGFLHSLTIKEGTKEEIRAKFAKELAIANGYHGHIMSVYGWPVMFMPASLRDVVHAFRQKYHTPVLERKRHNEPPHHQMG